jgi:hypothetical protein
MVSMELTFGPMKFKLLLPQKAAKIALSDKNPMPG